MSLKAVRIGTIAFITMLASLAFSAPNFLSYQGRIVKTDNTPLEEDGVEFEFSITNPTGDCRIYRETSSPKDMRNSKGLFDVPIGSGTKNYPSASTFKVLDSFKNGVTFNCEGGGTYLAADGDIRLLRVQFKDGTGWKLISPDNQIRSVPFAGYSDNAKSAQRLEDKVVSDFVLKADLPICTAGKFLRHISPSGTFTCDDITVTGSNVIGNISGSSAGFTGNLTGDVTGTQSTTSVDRIKNVPLNMTGLATGKVLKYNGTNWAPADDDTGGGATGITALTGDVTATGTGSVVATLSNDTVTSAKIVNGTILNEDINASAAIADSKLATISTAGKVSGSAITSGTIGGSTSINTSGMIQTSNSIRLYSDSNKYTEIKSPAGLADDQIFQLPPTAGTSGQVLTTNGAGILSWQTISAGGGTVTAVTASNPLSATTGNTPNISITQSNAATDGYLSSTDWNSFNAKLGTTTNFSGDISGSYNSMSVDKIRSKEVVPAAYAAGQVLRYDGTNWVNSILGLSDTTGVLALGRGGTGATSASGARTALELGTVATKNTGAIAGEVPVLGAAGLVSNGFCTADSAGTGIICNTSAPTSSQWTTSAPNIYYASGSVGIGTTSPTAKLHVNGPALVGPGTPSYTGTEEYLSLRSTSSAPGLLFDNGLSSLAKIGWSGDRLNFRKCSNADCSSASPYFEIDTTNRITTFSNMDSIRSGNGAGNATTPTYSFSTSNNTGIFSPATNTLSLSTNSSERFRITAAGDVGIGVTGPNAKLEVNGGIMVGADATCTAAKSGMIAYNSSNIQFCVNGSWVNLGASGGGDFKSDGTVSMTAPFKSYSGGAAAPGLSFAAAPTVGIFQASGKLGLATAGLERVTVAADGNVGIGINAPAVSLHVSSATAVSHASSTTGGPTSSFIKFRGSYSSFSATQAGDSLGSINFGGTYSSSAYTGEAASISSIAAGNFSSTSLPAALVFKTTATGATSPSVRMTVLENGNVGIGTTSPSQLLTVGGTIEAVTVSAVTLAGSAIGVGTVNTGIINASGSAPYWAPGTIRNTEANGYSGFGFVDSDGNNRGFVAYGNPSAVWSPSAVILGSMDASIPLAFTMGENEVGRFQANTGNFGIGITPTEKLHVNGNGKFTGSVVANGVTLTSDSRFKRNIASIESPLEKILNIRGVTYDWRQEEFPEKNFTDKKQLGVIAQEVEAQFPEAVNTDQDGYKSVSYTSLLAPLIEAVRELFVTKADVQRVEKLEQENQEMKQALCELGKKSFCKK